MFRVVPIPPILPFIERRMTRVGRESRGVSRSPAKRDRRIDGAVRKTQDRRMEIANGILGLRRTRRLTSRDDGLWFISAIHAD